MRGKITSDGTPEGSRIVTDDDAEIKGIKRASFVLDAGDGISAIDLTLCAYGVEAEGAFRFHVVHPETDKYMEVSKIVFADGSEWVA